MYEGANRLFTLAVAHCVQAGVLRMSPLLCSAERSSRPGRGSTTPLGWGVNFDCSEWGTLPIFVEP